MVVVQSLWVGNDLTDMEKYCFTPLLKIGKEIKRRFPNVPIIAFPRGIGGGYARFADMTEFSALALDQSVPVNWAKGLQEKVVIQGNLDPIHLVTGGKKLKAEVNHILDNFKTKPFIFNLGHGITPDATIKNVELLIEYVRN